MSTVTYTVQLKKLTRRKHIAFLKDQKEYSKAINWSVGELQKGNKLSSKDVPGPLKSAIKNESIRRAKKALSDVKQGLAKRVPRFKSSLPISINNQNWNTVEKKGRWYLGFTSGLGKLQLPVIENETVRTYFPFLTKEYKDIRKTLQLFRKGKKWYVAIPIEMASPIDGMSRDQQTPIGVDVGLRHLAVVSEPTSGKRQFFSGKEVGFKRRHFRSLRRSLSKKKALRAVKRVGQKEKRWMTNYNRQLARDIVLFSLQFENPIIKLEKLDDIRKTCKSTKRSDRTIHSWAFYQLKQFIRECASKYGITVTDIDPYKTSQTCSVCGHAEKKNRSRDRFCCRSCGYTSHADLNASHNIARA
ncbi:IS200/IS605 family element transposase accessory protein TnpB (plasmid) [Pontibacillus sp. ALD_SL1]|uniref:RNA-guided endonuclease TnpB family protein n=1 Tax=Pontibacillus sp. ALD_SL1 TaxID=2777185 RepID=UPI001A97AE8D|nr:RNA-guided endonuclease TnpB family protein [Pontibacillus sp. ALD_SL1]QST02759.1 IS200/IS605 family element transposase accessory protein TnpB [Pontibacillus sp. ALD_SL1]